MPSADPAASELRRLFDGLAAIGRDPAGGWSRFAWTPQDAAARDWFGTEARALGLALETDTAGNLWAWWGGRGPGPGAVAVGSHLDTVPRGGAYDGALGVVCALLAVATLRGRGVAPVRPVAVVAFADEEGARFGLATFGSRLLAGSLDVATALAATDAAGARFADVVAGAGLDPARMGPDRGRLAALGSFVELHVEQGRGLADLDAPIAVASGVWPHGRWRLTLEGEPNHAGTTRLADRRDAVLPLGTAIEAARSLATDLGAVATVGRIVIDPNSTNTVPGAVSAWLDARAADDETLDRLVDGWIGAVRSAAAANRVGCTVVAESRSAAVRFDDELADRLCAVVRARGLPAPRLPTAAGHDAAALAAVLPTGMLFVRNPTGVSHSPVEAASLEDCLVGAAVLTDVVEELACR